MDAREVALLTLVSCEKQGAWSEGALKKNIRTAKLDARDGALATRLCAGTLQNRMLLDFYLDGFSTVKVEKLEPKVLQALRLGVYQMLFLDRVPVSAAVNTSVELARKHSRNPKSPGFVNGVLRAMSRRLDDLPKPQGRQAEVLSIRYSHPLWLTEELLAQLGREETEALLTLHNAEPPMYAQLNPLKTSPERLAARWEAEGVTALPHPWLEGCFTLSGTGDLERLHSFAEGLFTIQDPAARLCVLAAGPSSGMEVLDVCAAPGGKSFAAAQMMENKGRIVSCDIHAHKQALIEKGAQRLGLSCIQAATQDGKAPRAEFVRAFDLVMADVPCSGLGVIRKKPDIRYKDPDPLAGLPAVQRAILDNVADYVKPGGVLLYSTCTVRRGENEDVVAGFLDRHKNFTLEEFELPQPLGRVEEGQLTLWPHRHGTDGFFIAKLRRRD